MLKLNLGANDDRKPGFLSVDICEPADVVTDLRLPWPWEDSTVDEIYAHDVFEHLSQEVGCIAFWGEELRRTRVSPKIWCMNEAFRVLKPGGILDLAVPCAMLSDGRMNPGAFADPTHVSYWTLDDRYYYGEEWNNPQGERGRLGPAYGIKALFRGEWKLMEYGAAHERRSKVVAMLRAVK